MDSFDYKKFLKEGRLYQEDNSEDQQINEVGKGYFKKEYGVGKKGFKMADRKKLSEDILSIYEKLQEGSYPFDQCLDDNEGKYGVEGAKKVCGAIERHMVKD